MNRKNLKKLQELGRKVAGLDERITEVFIHSDTPKDPLSGEEIYLVCHLADPEFNRDMEAYEEAGHPWSLEISESVEEIAREMGIEQEIVVAPFNFEFHAQNEYGDYYLTLFLKEGYDPILEVADKKRQESSEAAPWEEEQD